MIRIRRLAYVVLAIAFAQIVFGAIVRISGSGLGCGNHWPKCNGVWIPSFTGSEVIIEVSHRYGALAVSLGVLALVLLTLTQRRAAGIAGPNGPMRAALTALALVVTAALLGAATVKLDLPPQIIVLHLTIAMLLTAAIAAVAIRAGGFGVTAVLPGATPKTARAALAAAIVGLVAIALGGLTANIPGALAACRGFPHCALGMVSGPPLHIHLTHRVLAILLVLHVAGVVVGVTRRNEAVPLKVASRVALTLLLLQLVIAVVLVTYTPTPALRSLHQANGIAAGISLLVFALLARRGRKVSDAPVRAVSTELAGSLP